MNATVSRKPRKAPEPVHGTCRWMIRPLAVRDFESGVLAINVEEYVVTLPADRTGARLTKSDGTVYHVDLARCGCDCPDAQYRPRPGGCKHFKAIVAAVATLPAPVHRSAGQMAANDPEAFQEHMAAQCDDCLIDPPDAWQ